MREFRRPAVAAALGLSALVISGTSGCGGSSSKATLKVASNATLKQSIVVDPDGKTLYMFTVDTDAQASCVGDQPAPGCGKVWPPLTAEGELQGDEGIDEKLLGTTKRADGMTQVTYNNHPMYYFRGYGETPADNKAGDVNGQAFAGLWYVLSPKGEPITRRP
jgi:predicted lipoprotein with Yx(FWY)xxD motif